MPEWLASIPIGTAVAWIGGAVAAVLAVWKGWPAFRKLVGVLSRLVKLVDLLATLPEELGAIRHELEHNGGGSIKDSVVRTERAVAELSGEVKYVRRQAASLKTTAARTARRLDDHIINSASAETS